MRARTLASSSLRRLAFGAAIFGFGGLGCGADTTVDSYHDYRLRQAQALCEQQFRCCGRQCSTSADATFNKSIKSVEFAITQGLVTFNAAQAKACLDATNAVYTDCNQYVATVDTLAASRACTGIIQGALPLGTACSTSTDYCAPNTYCVTDTSLKPPQARCRRMLNIGDPCDGTVRCQTGSYCDTASTKVCTASMQSGSSGDPCSDTLPCGGALLCLPSSTCGLPQDGGQPCTADEQCISGRCAIDTCTVPMSRPTTVSDQLCGTSIIT